MLHNFSAILVPGYDKVIFRSFNFGSIDMQTEPVLSAVWQLAAFQENLSKYCP